MATRLYMHPSTVCILRFCFDVKYGLLSKEHVSTTRPE